MSKNGIAIKGTMDFDSVSAFLADLVKSFKERTVCVQRGEEFVTLTPGDVVELELEAVVKKGKQKLSLELAWKDEVLAEVEAPFKVSSKEPEVPVEAPAEESTVPDQMAEALAKTTAKEAVEKSPAPSAAAKTPEKKTEPKTGAAAKK